MTLKNLDKAPIPWFGGKRDAAPAVWAALGDVNHYVEPFAGSLAVLLCRPHQCNRAYYSETVNDLDGLLVNFWRAIQADPRATAEAASWPVAEIDLFARHYALVKWRETGGAEKLRADPAFYDAKMAGWWAWGCCSWIGSGWCSGTGPWYVDSDGRVVKQPPARKRKAGVASQLQHLGNDGQGVNRPQAREPGVASQLPHLNSNGQGVNHPQARELGVGEFHPMTMPELLRWFEFLSARLRHVRILNGDWKRALTGAVVKTLPVRNCGKKQKYAGVFLDPPYGHDVRAAKLYAEESSTVAQECQQWCVKNGTDPAVRIVLAGFDTEHEVLEREHGWSCVEWFKCGFLKGGMSVKGGKGTSQKRERLWLSPACIVPKNDEGLLLLENQ